MGRYFVYMVHVGCLYVRVCAWVECACVRGGGLYRRGVMFLHLNIMKCRCGDNLHTRLMRVRVACVWVWVCGLTVHEQEGSVKKGFWFVFMENANNAWKLT